MNKIKSKYLCVVNVLESIRIIQGMNTLQFAKMLVITKHANSYLKKFSRQVKQLKKYVIYLWFLKKTINGGINMKWYEKIIIFFLIILFSPLILFLLICLCISLPFISISDCKAYKKSTYFKTFKIPYDKDIVNSDKYIFYNYAIHEKLPINYIIQTTNSFEYFTFENQVFIFPDFNEIKYNDIKQEYEVIYRKNNKELYICSLDEFLDKQMKLFEENIDLPIKILLSRNYFDEEYLDIDNLPDSIHIIKNYYNAFKEENKELLSVLPKSTKTLYEMMLKNEKLGGKF